MTTVRIMDVVTMHQAKSALSQLVAKAINGETIYIGAYGKAQAKIVAVGNMDNPPAKKIGVLAGKLNVPDSFDDELPEDVLEEFFKG